MLSLAWAAGAIGTVRGANLEQGFNLSRLLLVATACTRVSAAEPRWPPGAEKVQVEVISWHLAK